MPRSKNNSVTPNEDSVWTEVICSGAEEESIMVLK